MKKIISKAVKRHIIKIFHIYLKSSTFHGIKYIGMIKLNIFERIFWLFAFITFFTFTCIASYSLWSKFDDKPTIVQIENTNIAFTDVIFPAVTICPSNRIKKSIAYDYLSRYVNATIADRNKIIMHVINALSMLQYPTYHFMRIHLKEVNDYLYMFDSLNITDFMIKTLPKVSEIMKKCIWHGEKENCSDIFSLQITEEGYCYSFNSLLSEDVDNCPVFVPQIMFLLDQEVHYNDPKCIPKSTTASGPFSGLTVIMKEGFPLSKDKIDDNGTKYEDGVVVILNTPYELPEAGSGSVLETRTGNMLQMEVKPLIMGSSRKLSFISQENRGCRLRNDKTLRLYDLYTQSTCLAECRHRYIEKRCKCQLYFLYDKSSPYPLCKVKQLKCITTLKSVLTTKDLSAPSVNIPLCKCTLPCYGIIYESVSKRSNLTYFNGQTYLGMLDIYFSAQGGIKYFKRLSFTDLKLVVSIGNIGNLFLGCSIISVMEFIYYFIRALIICRLKPNKRK